MKQGKPEQALTIADHRNLDKRVLLTKAIEDELVASMASGMFEKQACQFAGIDFMVFQQWKRWAEKGVEPYTGFFRRVLAAKKERVQWALAQVQNCTKEWKAAAWWLDRFCPEWREGNMTDQPLPAPPVETIIREVSARFTPDEVKQIAGALLGVDPVIDQLPAHGDAGGAGDRGSVEGASGEAEGDAEEAVATVPGEGEDR